MLKSMGHILARDTLTLLVLLVGICVIASAIVTMYLYVHYQVDYPWPIWLLGAGVVIVGVGDVLRPRPIGDGHFAATCIVAGILLMAVMAAWNVLP